MKLRGHLGSELQRKAAAILSIERDDDPQISVVKALKVRDGSPLDVPLVQFSWDRELGMHAYIGDKPKEEKDKRKEMELSGVARTIFSKRRYYTILPYQTVPTHPILKLLQNPLKRSLLQEQKIL